MSRWEVVGQLVTPDGMCVTSYFSPLPEHMWKPIRHRSWVVDPAELRSAQPRQIPVRLDYGPDVGAILHLQRRPDDGSVWAVLDADFDPAARDYYLHPDIVDGTIVGVTLRERNQQTGQWAALMFRNGLDRDGKAKWRLGEWPKTLLEHADTARNRRHSSAPLIIRDDSPFAMLASITQAAPGLRSAPQLETRSIETIGVSTNDRVITLVVAPYEQPAPVIIKGRWVKEVYARTAFKAIRRQGNKVRVNRDHDVTRTIGRAIAFDPDHAQGLVAEVYISATELGTETLQLAADDCLSASAGFRCLRESWPDRDTRRVETGWLEHIALTPEPAYESADVLNVRS